MPKRYNSIDWQNKYPQNYKMQKVWSEKSLKYYKSKCKRLQAQIDDWKYEMVYFTDEDMPTPKGTAKFIMDKVFYKKLLKTAWSKK